MYLYNTNVHQLNQQVKFVSYENNMSLKNLLVQPKSGL